MLGRPVIRYEEVGSTMDVLADLAALGAPEGTTVVAEFQSVGRGRAHRPWVAPRGAALLHSILLRPELAPRRLTPLSILVGEAIVATMRDVYNLPAQLKWPNDVLIHGRKISGVLIQNRGTLSAVIVGVGINANVRAGDLPDVGTSLSVELDETVNRDALMHAFLDRLDVRYCELLSGDIVNRLNQVHEVLAFRGETVIVHEGDARVEGRLRGIDTDGALLLDVDGSVRRIVVGDVTRGPWAKDST